MFAVQRKPSQTIASPAVRRPAVGAGRSLSNPLWHHLSTRVQAKLKVGQPGDAFEQEADRVADQVLRMPAPSGSAGGEVVSAKASPPAIQRMCSSCEDELQRQPADSSAGMLQRKRAGRVDAVSTSRPSAVTQLGISRGNGRPLPAAARSYFEPRFGTDFGHVRVHTDASAAESARALDALAYTAGADIVFGSGQFAPESPRGQRLLAHELTHVIQQTAANSPGYAESSGARQSIGSWSPAPYIARLSCPDTHDRRNCPVGQKCGANDKGTCRFPNIETGCTCYESSENPPSHRPTALGMLGAGLGSILGGLGLGALGIVGGAPGMAYGTRKGAEMGSDFGGAVGDAIQSGIEWLFGD